MPPAFILVRDVRTHLLAAALGLWSTAFSGASLAQGPDPFGPVPELSLGNNPAFGNTSTLGAVRAPMTPQVTARPSSWPGGNAFEPESLGGPAARPARPMGKRMAVDGQVVPASAIEDVPGLDQDAGFSFAEEQGGPRRRPQRQPQPQQPAPAAAHPLTQGVPAGNAPPPAFPANPPPTLTQPPMFAVQSPPPGAGPVVVGPATLTPVTVAPAQPERTILSPYQQPQPPADPMVVNRAPSAGAVLIPQLGAPPASVNPPTMAAPSAEMIRSFPPLVNPYSLDPAPRATAAAPSYAPANPAVNQPFNPPRDLSMKPVATPTVVAPAVAPPVNVPAVRPVVSALAVPRQALAAAQPPAGVVRNPFQGGIPGEPSLPSGRLNTPPAAVRLDGPDQQQLAAAQASLIRNPFIDAPSAAREAPGTASAASAPVAMPAAVIRNPIAPPSGEVFVSDGPNSRPTLPVAPVQPAPAAQPSQPTAPQGPMQPWGPLNTTPTFRRDGPRAQAFPLVPPNVSAQAGPANPAAVVAQAAAPQSVPASPYVVESKSPDTIAPPADTRAFPAQLPQPTSQRIANPPSVKTAFPARPEGMLLAQAGGVPGEAMANSALPQQGALPPLMDKMSAPTQAASVEPGMAPCEGAQILARVGSEIILSADVAGPVNEMLTLNKDKIPPEQMELAREQLTRRLLDARIETKLAYQDAKRQLPAEAVTRVEKNIGDAFDREEIEKLMKRAGAGSRQELDVKLQSLGSSLELKRRAFVEQMLAQQWIRQQVKVDGEVSHEQMINFYHAHISEFETPAQVRWEELEVRFARHPRREEAYALIAQMGNRVLRGERLADVARQSSEGITAANGGQRDWTSRGSLVSHELDNALFGLPVNEPSQIIEDKTGLHILRVLERKEAVRTPFTEAQVEIRKKIKDQRVETQMKAYLDKARRQVPVWTVFDDQPGHGVGAREGARGKG